jgi:hypothetical protein
MDILKMMWALISEGNHRVSDVLEMGFWLAKSRYVDGDDVSITRRTAG